VIDPSTGAARMTQLFVGVLGASNYIYAEATWTQSLSAWIGARSKLAKNSTRPPPPPSVRRSI
jgi:transposase